MSKCISSHGEYSDHEPGDPCPYCGEYDIDRIIAERDKAERAATRANARADVCLAQTRYWQGRARDLQAAAWDRGYRDTMAYVASGNLNGDECHAVPVNPYSRLGSPDRACGRGPCALGHGHDGECCM